MSAAKRLKLSLEPHEEREVERVLPSGEEVTMRSLTPADKLTDTLRQVYWDLDDNMQPIIPDNAAEVAAAAAGAAAVGESDFAAAARYLREAADALAPLTDAVNLARRRRYLGVQQVAGGRESAPRQDLGVCFVAKKDNLSRAADVLLAGADNLRARAAEERAYSAEFLRVRQRWRVRHTRGAGAGGPGGPGGDASRRAICDVGLGTVGLPNPRPVDVWVSRAAVGAAHGGGAAKAERASDVASGARGAKDSAGSDDLLDLVLPPVCASARRLRVSVTLPSPSAGGGEGEGNGSEGTAAHGLRGIQFGRRASLDVPEWHAALLGAQETLVATELFTALAQEASASAWTGIVTVAAGSLTLALTNDASVCVSLVRADGAGDEASAGTAGGGSAVASAEATNHNPSRSAAPSTGLLAALLEVRLRQQFLARLAGARAARSRVPPAPILNLTSFGGGAGGAGGVAERRRAFSVSVAAQLALDSSLVTHLKDVCDHGEFLRRVLARLNRCACTCGRLGQRMVVHLRAGLCSAATSSVVVCLDASATRGRGPSGTGALIPSRSVRFELSLHRGAIRVLDMARGETVVVPECHLVAFFVRAAMLQRAAVLRTYATAAGWTALHDAGSWGGADAAAAATAPPAGGPSANQWPPTRVSLRHPERAAVLTVLFEMTAEDRIVTHVSLWPFFARSSGARGAKGAATAGADGDGDLERLRGRLPPAGTLDDVCGATMAEKSQRLLMALTAT